MILVGSANLVSISTGTNINVSGNDTISKNITVNSSCFESNSLCINITANNVVLDCHNYTMAFSNSSSIVNRSLILVISAENIIIKNYNVRNFHIGIEVNDSKNTIFDR